MNFHARKSMSKHFRKAISLVLIAAFIGSSLYVPQAQAGEMVMPVIPKPGIMVNLSPAYTPAYLKGIVIHPENALKFDFLVHKGDGNLDQDQKKEEYTKLIKYFLASLTVPDQDQWVNLSPYEKDRIVADDFGKTEMGRDLLGQDYLLKQITASLMYPESGLGRAFWDKVYQRAYQEFGTTNIPVNTFNKVWIVPDEALIYESGNTAYVVKSHLKVMLEEDYLSLKKHTAIENPDSKQNALHSVSSKVIKEIILPEIEREVNGGKNFAMLRQVFSGMVLATWYKMALKESLLGKVYADKAKVQGVNQDPKNNEAIYQRYLRAFKKGVYNYIKEDTDKYTNQVIPRKYFAGGFVKDLTMLKHEHVSRAMLSDAESNDSDLEYLTAMLDPAQMAEKINRRQALGLGAAALGAALVPRLALAGATQQGTFRYALDTVRGELRKFLDANPELIPQFIPLWNKLNVLIENHVAYMMGYRKNNPTVELVINPTVIREAKDVYAAMDSLNDFLSKAPVPVAEKVLVKVKDFNIEHGVIALKIDDLFEKIQEAIRVKDPLLLAQWKGKVPAVQEILNLEAGFLKAYPKAYIAELQPKRKSRDIKVLAWLSYLSQSEMPHYVLWRLINLSTPEDKKVAVEVLNLLGIGMPNNMAGVKMWEEVKRTILKSFSNGKDLKEKARRMKTAAAENKAMISSQERPIPITVKTELNSLLKEIAKSKGPNVVDWVVFKASEDVKNIENTTDLGAIIERMNKYIEKTYPQEYSQWLSRSGEILYIGLSEALMDNLAYSLASRTQPTTEMSMEPSFEELQRMIYGQTININTEVLVISLPKSKFDTYMLPFKYTPLGQIEFTQAKIIVEKKEIELGRIEDRLFLLKRWMREKMEGLRKKIARSRGVTDNAQITPTGGIDLNAANLDLQIKRDGNGVPLPLAQQDMAQLSRIGGFVPRILEIKPASSLPFMKEISPDSATRPSL